MKKIRLTESQLNRVILNTAKRLIRENKHLLREGAGAGYTVSFEYVHASKVEYKEVPNKDSLLAKVYIKPEPVEWSAEGYDFGTSSDDEKYYYDESENIIDEGVLTILLENKEFYESLCQHYNMTIQEYLNDVFSTFSFSFTFGGGYVHQDLPEKIYAPQCKVSVYQAGMTETYYGTALFTAPIIANNINNAFAHRYDDEDEF